MSLEYEKGAMIDLKTFMCGKSENIREKNKKKKRRRRRLDTSKNDDDDDGNRKQVDEYIKTGLFQLKTYVRFQHIHSASHHTSFSITIIVLIFFHRVYVQ